MLPRMAYCTYLLNRRRRGSTLSLAWLAAHNLLCLFLFLALTSVLLTLGAAIVDSSTASTWQYHLPRHKIHSSARLKACHNITTRKFHGNSSLFVVVTAMTNQITGSWNMDNLSDTSRQRLSLHRTWDPVFSTRRDLNLENENKSYLQSEWGEDLNVRDFMKGSSKVSPFQVEEVTKFCSGLSLESLEGNTSNQGFVAWLDDRSKERGEVRSRIHQNPLTASGLYKELKKKVRTFTYYLKLEKLTRTLMFL